MNPEDQEKGGQLLQLFARHNRELRAYSRLILHSVDSVDVLQEAQCRNLGKLVGSFSVSSDAVWRVEAPQ